MGRGCCGGGISRPMLFFLLNLLLSGAVAAQPALQPGQRYLLRLLNGDVLEGQFVDSTQLSDTLPAWRFRTLIGTATIAVREVAELVPLEEHYRHGHRIFLQPTAEPVAGNGFIGLAGLFALYAGVGLQDWLSVVGGHTLLPKVPAAEQLWVLNVKFTLLQAPNLTMPGTLWLAVGGNITALNSANQLLHLYAVGSVAGVRTRLSAAVMAKLAGEDLMTVRFGSWGSVPVAYQSGAVGIALGLDYRPSARRDMRLLLELWNADIRSPSRTGILAGVRLYNSAVALDFGLFWFGYPLAIPAANVAWTPL
jgi:hypothetical protein